jgi:hypothetical protein
MHALTARLRVLLVVALAPLGVPALLGSNCTGGPPPVPHRRIGNARLGAGCQFNTFAAALAASADGDELRWRVDRSFSENVTVNKAVRIVATTSASCDATPPAPNGARPELRPVGANTPMIITASGAVTLVDLILSHGVGADGGNLATAQSADVTLTHVELRDGNAQRGGGVEALGPLLLDGGTRIAHNSATEGGGVYVKGGTLTLADAVIESNTTESDGAGIYANFASVVEAGGAITVDVRGNHAQNDGGGLYVKGGSVQLAATFTSFNVADENGGGVAVDESPPTTLELGPLDHNTAIQGGGLYASSSAFTITHLGDVTNNDAYYGGGAWLSGPIAIRTRANFLHNVATSAGGGVAFYYGASWSPGGSLIGNSTGGDGGGAMLSGSTIDWSDYGEIAGNVAGGLGGGVDLHCFNASSLSIAQGYVHGNAAGSGGAIFANGFMGRPCAVQLTAATALEDNHASDDGGGIAAVGTAELHLQEIKARRNAADRNGGAIATIADDAGVPEITVLNRDDGQPNCQHAPLVPGFDEYCVEFRDNTAGADGGALHLESATGSVAQAGFAGNDARGRGDAAVLGSSTGTANVTFDDVLFSDHVAASEVVWVRAGSTLTARQVTAASNAGVPLRWSAGSSGTLRNSAIADAAVVLDAGVALGGDCNALFAAPTGTGTLAGAFDVGLTATAFFTDPARGRFQVAPGAPLLDDRCTTGTVFDLDDAPRDALRDRGAFEQR